MKKRATVTVRLALSAGTSRRRAARGFVWLAWAALGWTLAGCEDGAGPGGCTDCNVTGFWIGRYESDEGSRGNFSVSIAQAGTSISGVFEQGTSDLEGAALVGTVSGGSITFGDDAGQVSFAGSVFEDLTASGTFAFAAAGVRGPWWASLAERGTFELEPCITLDSYHVRALAHDGTNLWYIDGSGNLKKSDETGHVLGEYTIPGGVGGEVQLSFGDGVLWLSDYTSAARIDLEGRVLEQRTGVTTTHHLAWAAGSLWAQDSAGPALHRLDPGTLQIVESFATTVPAPGPMVFDGAFLWIVSGLSMPSSDVGAVDLLGTTRAYHRLPPDFQVGAIAHDGNSLWVGSGPGPAGPADARICKLRLAP
jgi:hypothetical protein